MRFFVCVCFLGIFLQAQSEEKILEFIKSKLQFKKYVIGQAQFDLQFFKDKKLAPMLVECLQMGRRREDNNSVRHIIVRKLGEFKYKPAAKTLIEIIKGKDDPWWIKSAALEALLQMKYDNVFFYLKVLEFENLMLQKRSLIALQTITKKNNTITMKSSLDDVRKMRKLWLQWGIKYRKSRQKNTQKK